MRLPEATLVLTVLALAAGALGLQQEPEPPEILFDPDAGPEGVDHGSGEPGGFRAPSEDEMEKFGVEDAVQDVEEVRD